MFELLKGKVLTDIKINKNKTIVVFKCSENEKYIMFHKKDCGEKVYIDDIIGDINNLIGYPILLAEEVTNGREKIIQNSGYIRYRTFTWTFYKLSTIKGSVTIKWYGTSNGYYSESVSFERTRG